MSQNYTPGPGGPPPFDPQQPGDQVPRRSSGLAWKILLGLLAGGVVLTVVCAGIGYFALRNVMSMDPEKVRSVAREIAVIDVPDYFRPMMSMTIAGVRMAFFDSEDQRGVLVLVDASDPALQQNREQFEEQMRKELQQKFKQQGRQQGEEIETRTETFQIKGQPIEMQVLKLEGDDGTISHEISGSFDGNENFAFLHVLAPEDKLTEDDLRRMIESIE